MSFNRFVYSSVTLIIGLFFVLLGSVGILLPWAEKIQHALVRFIQEDTFALSLFGSALIVVGAALLLYVILSGRRHSYYLRSGAKAVALDETVFQQFLGHYWKERFAEREIPCRILLKRGKVCISADFPFLSKEQQRPFLESLKNDLQAVLADQLGYRDQFELYATFQKEEPSKGKVG
jgi:hypothetical protein